MTAQHGQHTPRDKKHTCSPPLSRHSRSGVNHTVLPLQQVLMCSRGL